MLSTAIPLIYLRFISLKVYLLAFIGFHTIEIIASFNYTTDSHLGHPVRGAEAGALSSQDAVLVGAVQVVW